MEKIRINDFRLSRELFQLELLNVSGSIDADLYFLKALAAVRINIEFLTRTCIDEKSRSSFCIRSEFHDMVKRLLDPEPSLKDLTKFIPSVGLVTLFPHRFSLEILGLSLNVLGRARLPIHGIASSISSITFVTDFERLEEAVKELQEGLLHGDDRRLL